MHGFDLYTWRVEYGTSALTSSFEELDSNLATSLFAKAVDLRSGQRRVLGKNREMLNIPAAQNLHVGQERAQSHPYSWPLTLFPIFRLVKKRMETGLRQLRNSAITEKKQVLRHLFTDPSILGWSVVISVDWITSHAKGDGRVLIFTHSRQNIKKTWTGLEKFGHVSKVSYSLKIGQKKPE